MPCLDYCYLFLFYLLIFFALQVDWDDEKICFQTIAAAIGNFYAFHPPMLPNPSGDGLQFYKRLPSGTPEEGIASLTAGKIVMLRTPCIIDMITVS